MASLGPDRLGLIDFDTHDRSTSQVQAMYTLITGEQQNEVQDDVLADKHSMPLLGLQEVTGAWA